MAQAASIAVGGALAVLAIVAATHTYGNKVAVYVMSFLVGLYAYFLRDKPKLVLATALPLALISLTFSGFTMYWDYAAGNQVAQASYAALAPHIGCAPQPGYLGLADKRDPGHGARLAPARMPRAIQRRQKRPPISGQQHMAQYYSGLSYVARGNVVYSDGFNYLVST